jgi:predicted peptidase
MRIKRFLSIAWVILFAAPGTHVCSASGSSYAASSKSESADTHMISVVPITEVFADGWKVSAIAVKYDRNISDASLSPSAYTVTTEVPGQTITKVYTSTDGEKTSQKGQNGQYVILELSTDYVIPVSRSTGAKSTNLGPMTPGQGPANAGQGTTNAKEGLTLNSEVVNKVGNLSWDPSAHPATLKSSLHGGNGKTVSVAQLGNITATDGMTITASSSAKDNEYCRNLIVDGFMKPDYNGADGSRAKYNIYFPRDYDAAKTYPTVVFMTSSMPGNGRHADVLIQGLGGVIWADKNEQARHESIVIVPAFGEALVNENLEPAERQGPQGRTENQYQSVLATIDYLRENVPNIDKNRIYLTGQGEGARAAMKMMTDRPNMFAAALLFSPDYDKTQISKLSKDKMWIVVSEGDDQSYPSMESGMNSLKAAGARISQAEWNGQANAAQFASYVGGMIKEGSNIKYTVLKKGTVVPPGVSDDAVNNHAYTWRIGYSIQGLRDWLFSQSK